jgi:hypothetical protein
VAFNSLFEVEPEKVKSYIKEEADTQKAHTGARIG